MTLEPASRQPYIYRITETVTVVDGDTWRLRVDLGYHVTVLVSVRLLGYDCPERHKGSLFERDRAGHAAHVAAMFLMPVDDQPLWVRTEKDPDSFGRWLGDVWRDTPDGELHLGAILSSQGVATTWPTRWRTVYDPTP